MEISNLLQIKKGVTSIIGGGGKTTLMLKLASELMEKGTCVVCTTTRIFPPEDIRLVTSSNLDDLSKEIARNKVICVSEGLDPNGKLMPPKVPFEKLQEIADYIICEADGSRGLPLKAHNENEPVIPKESNQTILVIGIDGIGKRINEVCHRTEIYSWLSGVNEDVVVTPEIVAEVVNKESFGTKALINKVENETDMSAAIKVAELIKLPVIAGSLRNGEYKCL